MCGTCPLDSVPFASICPNPLPLWIQHQYRQLKIIGNKAHLPLSRGRGRPLPFIRLGHQPFANRIRFDVIDGIVDGLCVPKIAVEATARLPKTKNLLATASHQKPPRAGVQRIFKTLSVPFRHHILYAAADCGNIVCGISGPNQQMNVRGHYDIGPNAVIVQRFPFCQCS